MERYVRRLWGPHGNGNYKVQAKINTDIEEYRKADALVEVVASDGAEVNIETVPAEGEECMEAVLSARPPTGKAIGLLTLCVRNV